MIGKAAPQRCARSSAATQSATCKIGPLGVSTFVQSRIVEPFAASYAASASDNRDNSYGQNWSGARRGGGMGSLECRCAAPATASRGRQPRWQPVVGGGRGRLMEVAGAAGAGADGSGRSRRRPHWQAKQATTSSWLVVVLVAGGAGSAAGAPRVLL